MSTALLALLPAVLLAPVPKDLEAKIKWRLTKGDVFYVTSVDQSSGTVTIKAVVGGPPALLKTTTTMTSVVKYEVLAATDKARVVTVTYLSIAGSVGVAGNAPTPITPDLTGGAAVTLTLDAKLQVTKVEGFKAFVEKLGGTALPGGVTSGKSFGDALKQVFAVVPPRGIRVGDKWEQKASLSLGAMGNMDRVTKYAAADLKDATGYVVIDTVSDYNWSASEQKPDPKAVTPTVVSADVKAEKCKGTVTFDPKRGRLVRSTEVIPFAGTISMRVGNMTIDMTMDTKSTRTLTVTDTAPKTK